MDRLVFLVQICHDWLSIIDCRSCVNVNRVDLGRFFQELEAIRSDVELKFVSSDRKSHISLFTCEHRVNEGLVEVEHQELLLGV